MSEQKTPQEAFEDSMELMGDRDHETIDRYYMVDQFESDMMIEYDWRFASANPMRCIGLDDGCTCDSCEDAAGFYASRTNR